jgi:hypothetical protein
MPRHFFQIMSHCRNQLMGDGYIDRVTGKQLSAFHAMNHFGNDEIDLAALKRVEKSHAHPITGVVLELYNSPVEYVIDRIRISALL